MFPAKIKSTSTNLPTSLLDPTWKSTSLTGRCFIRCRWSSQPHIENDFRGPGFDAVGHTGLGARQFQYAARSRRSIRRCGLCHGDQRKAPAEIYATLTQLARLFRDISACDAVGRFKIGFDENFSAPQGHDSIYLRLANGSKARHAVSLDRWPRSGPQVGALIQRFHEESPTPHHPVSAHLRPFRIHCWGH